MPNSKPRRTLSLLTLTLLVAALFAGGGLQLTASALSGNAATADYEILETGETGETEPFADYEIVEIDDSRIIHRPQEPLDVELKPMTFLQKAFYIEKNANVNVGTTQLFDMDEIYNTYEDKINERDTMRRLNFRVMAISEHAIVWLPVHTGANSYHSTTGVRACSTSTCTISSITTQMAQNIAYDFDEIYKMMTHPTTGFAPHNGVLANLGFSNLPAIGDIGSDGRVNIMLYDIGDDGRTNFNGGWTGGFFWSADYYNIPGYNTNALDMFHMDIGFGQGFDSLKSGATESDKLRFLNTMAHEFQHMLYYMHYRAYVWSTEGDIMIIEPDTWINEYLSGLAGTYYAKSGTIAASNARLVSAADNNWVGLDDFLYFDMSGSPSKSYGMAYTFGSWLQREYPNFVRRFYNNLQSEFPRANSYAENQVNREKIKAAGTRQTIGNALRAGTNNQVGTGGENSLRAIYFEFMQAFAADGGSLILPSSAPRQLTKIYDGPPLLTTPPYNLWAIRPVIGGSNRIYDTVAETINGFGSGIIISGTAITGLNSGNSIALNGGTSGGTTFTGFRERVWRLNPHADSTRTTLTITPPATTGTLGNLGEIRYYAVVMNDEILGSGSTTRATGVNGADVYPLTKDVSNEIETEGYPAYLMAVIYDAILPNSAVNFSWSVPVIEYELEGGVLKIESDKGMAQYHNKTTPIERSSVHTIVIGAAVTRLTSGDFADCTDLEGIIFRDSATAKAIAASAFPDNPLNVFVGINRQNLFNTSMFPAGSTIRQARIWESDTVPAVSNNQNIVILPGAEGRLTVNNNVTANIVSAGPVVNRDGFYLELVINGTLNWSADYSGSEIEWSLIDLFGAGTLNVTGRIQNTATSGSALALPYDDGDFTGTINISGDAHIQSANAYALYFANAKINISGGKITNYHQHGTIHSYGTIIITGGEINNNAAYPVFNLYQNAQVLICGGEIVGKYGEPGGNSIIVIWDKSENTIYELGTSTDLEVLPDTATAIWSNDGKSHGISFERGQNSGFFAIEEVNCGEGVETCGCVVCNPKTDGDCRTCGCADCYPPDGKCKVCDNCTVPTGLADVSGFAVTAIVFAVGSAGLWSYARRKRA
ncbi:MAG: hypothetical protein FWH20_07530 [Oscillospiraceae bacterium]|nr:hypothetical protein [Oscillospiraceae bacterium]